MFSFYFAKKIIGEVSETAEKVLGSSSDIGVVSSVKNIFEEKSGDDDVDLDIFFLGDN